MREDLNRLSKAAADGGRQREPSRSTGKRSRLLRQVRQILGKDPRR